MCLIYDLIPYVPLEKTVIQYFVFVQYVYVIPNSLEMPNGFVSDSTFV